MDFPSYLLAYIAALTIALLGIMVVRMSQKKHLKRRQQRRDLIKRGKGLPLIKIVQQAEVSLGKFFYSTPLTDVHEAIEFCEACSAAGQCKFQVSQGEISISEGECCPVRDRIEHHIQ